MSATPLLLNADLAEWEAAELTARFLPHLDQANLACGGHAGSPERLRQTARLAERYELRLGAHPGLREGNGRTAPAHFTPTDFERLLRSQLSTYQKNAPLHHLKLHGALYHLSEQSSEIRTVLFDVVARLEIPIICRAGGQVEAEAREHSLPVYPEAFLDRHYQQNGALVPRDQEPSLITDPAVAAERIHALRNHRPWTTADGLPIPLLTPATLCVHADTPQSLRLLEVVRRSLLTLQS